MMFMLEQNPVAEKKCVSFVECNSLLSLKNNTENRNTKHLLTFSSSYNESTDTCGKK